MSLFRFLTFRLLAATCFGLLILTLALLLVVNRQVRAILDQSQTAHFQGRIDSILNSLQLQEEKLQATGLPDSYRADFQAAQLRNLRATHYLHSSLDKVPLIFTLEGRVLLHPLLTEGQRLDSPEWDLARIRERRNGQFVVSTGQGTEDWCIFKYFEPWGWVVGYALPVSVKYADAGKLLNDLGLTIFVILLPIALCLSLYIRRQLQPIGALTEAAQHMGEGDLAHPLALTPRGELGLLTRSFARMRDQIKAELENRSRRLDRIQRQQQALIYLTRHNVTPEEDLTPFLRLASEQLGLVLSAERISIWGFDQDQRQLHCEDLYLPGQGHQDESVPLQVENNPEILAFLIDGQATRRDPSGTVRPLSTFPDRESATPPSSLALDIPVRVGGKTRALIRLEQTSGAVSWYEDEILFINHVAEQISQAMDRAERRRTALEMAHLRRELASIFDSMPSILIGIDRHLCIRHWNREAEKRIGLSEKQVLGRSVFECLQQLKPHQVMIEHALTEALIRTRRKLAWTLNDRCLYYDLTVYPLLDEETAGAVIRIDDVSDRVRLEDMMIQTEKMLSVGGLAAGMAHEINNPLAGILQSIQVIRNRMSIGLARNAEVARACGTSIEAIAAYIEKRDLQPLFEALSESGTRVALIVNNMLDFSRRSESRQAPHHIGTLIDRTLELAANDYDLKRNFDFRKIKIVRDEEADLPFVPCSATEIQQVLLSLLKNGAQAMFDDPDCSEPCFILRTRREGQFVRIEVCDNGPGIPENIRRRMFEPFFTTKGVGIGTGLGLSVSYFIVREKHGGSMEVSSQAGHGSRVIIRLPLIANAGGTA